MNVEIGAEAAQFPEKEYINGIAFAVQTSEAGLERIPILTYLANQSLRVPLDHRCTLFMMVVQKF
jgi:hypothetical protein